MGIHEVATLIKSSLIGIKKNHSKLYHYLNTTLEYCSRFNNFREITIVKEIKELLAYRQFTNTGPFTIDELGIIVDLMPITSEEAKTILKSLMRIEDGELQFLLDDFKIFLESSKVSRI